MTVYGPFEHFDLNDRRVLLRLQASVGLAASFVCNVMYKGQVKTECKRTNLSTRPAGG